MATVSMSTFSELSINTTGDKPVTALNGSRVVTSLTNLLYRYSNYLILKRSNFSRKVYVYVCKP